MPENLLGSLAHHQRNTLCYGGKLSLRIATGTVLSPLIKIGERLIPDFEVCENGLNGGKIRVKYKSEYILAVC